MATSDTRLPVTVLSGFLGAGKTTVLSALLKMPAMANTAVIINEFGEVGLDHNLVEHSEDTVVELRSGCICCTIRSDLHRTLQSLIGRRYIGSGFERVEATGLADHVPIIHTLMTSADLLPPYHLETVVTVVDAVNGGRTLDMHPESLKQIALAKRLVLSKLDLVSRDAKRDLMERLIRINPAATILGSVALTCLAVVWLAFAFCQAATAKMSNSLFTNRISSLTRGLHVMQCPRRIIRITSKPLIVAAAVLVV